jgi:hypothetical protein
MRALLAIVAVILAGTSVAEAAKYGGRGRAYYYAGQPPRGDSECERRARAEDPTGQFAGYPCWAREAFGRGRSGRGR